MNHALIRGLGWLTSKAKRGHHGTSLFRHYVFGLRRRQLGLLHRRGPCHYANERSCLAAHL